MTQIRIYSVELKKEITIWTQNRIYSVGLGIEITVLDSKYNLQCTVGLRIQLKV